MAANVVLPVSQHLVSGTTFVAALEITLSSELERLMGWNKPVKWEDAVRQFELVKEAVTMDKDFDPTSHLQALYDYFSRVEDCIILVSYLIIGACALKACAQHAAM